MKNLLKIELKMGLNFNYPHFVVGGLLWRYDNV